MFEKEAEDNKPPYAFCALDTKCELWKDGFQKGSEFGYNKANEWHNLNKNYKDLPDEGEWVEGLYIWYYKDKPHWDVFKVRWYYEIGELDEKLVCWYSSDDCWNKVDEPDYWRRIVLPTRSEYERQIHTANE